MQIRASEAPREAPRLRRPPLGRVGLRISSDSDPRRGLFDSSGELGPRPPGLDFGATRPILAGGLSYRVGAGA
eukprot:6995666-Alexandrium_andersonii.AAC.1